jgi:hypothetical protein
MPRDNKVSTLVSKNQARLKFMIVTLSGRASADVNLTVMTCPSRIRFLSWVTNTDLWQKSPSHLSARGAEREGRAQSVNLLTG